jgi:hypothetical protein
LRKDQRNKILQENANTFVSIYHDDCGYLFKSSAMVASCSRAASKSATISEGNDLGRGQVCQFFQRIVFLPKDVEVHFVTLGQFVVSEALEPFALLWFGNRLRGREIANDRPDRNALCSSRMRRLREWKTFA